MSTKIGHKLADNYKNAIGNYTLVKDTRIIIDSSLVYLATGRAVEELVKHFDARLMNAFPVLEQENGQYLLIDGARAFLALQEIMHRKGRKEFDVMCRVFTGLDREDVAWMYATHDDLLRKVPMPYKIRALEIARDPEITDFIKVTNSSGLTVKPGDSKRRNGHIAAICSALKAYRKLGKKEYLRMLKLIYKTWGGESWSLSMNMLGGMASFIASHDINSNKFARLFRHVTYEDIFGKALEFRGMSMEGAFTAAIADLYADLTGEVMAEAV